MSERYSPKEAAAKLGYSYCYFMKMIKAGRFQHHRMSEKRIYFTGEDLDAIEKASLVPAKGEIW